jgi:uncharacterized membrane protein YsdA (DUF1294 family)
MPATRDRWQPSRSTRSSPVRCHSGARVSPHRLFILIGVLLAIAITTSLHWGLHWAWAWSYLLAINLATAALYFHDKRSASSGWLRVPERVLHAFAFAGGTPAAYVSQRVLRHKTLKSQFRVWFFLIFVIQLLLIGAWWYWQRS